MKVKELVKKLLELDQDTEIELSTEFIDALDINPIVNDRKFPTQRDKVVFTYKRNDILPLSLHCYFYNARIDRDYQFRLIRTMSIFSRKKLNYRRFRTSIGRWSFRPKDNNIISTRP